MAPALVNGDRSIDSMSDRVYCGRRRGVLNIVDEGIREPLGFVVRTPITAAGAACFWSN